MHSPCTLGIMLCDTCGATVPERAATEAQMATMQRIVSGGALMLARRVATQNRAKLTEDSCPKCGKDLRPVECAPVPDGVALS